MPQDEPKQKPAVVVSDEDWKERVKAEDAALDEKLATGAPAGEASKQAPKPDASSPGPSEEPMPPLPSPTFSTIVALLSTQAMVALGVVPNPSSGKMDVQLELAKHFIEMLDVLQEKTRSNLLGREADLLENSLHQLRLAYVETTKQGKG